MINDNALNALVHRVDELCERTIFTTNGHLDEIVSIVNDLVTALRHMTPEDKPVPQPDRIDHLGRVLTVSDWLKTRTYEDTTLQGLSISASTMLDLFADRYLEVPETDEHIDYDYEPELEF